MSKIIIIGPAHPYRGGLATFNERLAMECVQEGHTVEIWTFTFQYPGFLFPGKTQYSESEAPENIAIFRKIHTINPFSWWKVAHDLVKNKPDFIVFRFWTPFLAPCLGTIAKLVKKRSTAICVGLIDNIIPHEKSWIDKKAAHYFTKYMDGFITMSKDVTKDLEAFTNKEIQLTEHPMQDNFGSKVSLENAREALGLPKDDYIFLYFGFIRKYKGVDMLIEAIDLLPSVKNNYCVVIAGEYYAERDVIEKAIAKSPNKSRIITHTHFIDNEAVKLYFSAVNCVIQPYRSATQSGVTPLAYHFEVPMIVTNVGGLPEYVEKDLGIVCEPNPLAIANAMHDMFTFPIETFRTAIIEAKKKLSWKTFVQKMISFKK